MVTIIGLGFVGLTTALCFAAKGITVYGYDVSREKMSSLRDSRVPFFEPHLQEALEQTRDKTFFVSDLSDALSRSECAFLCVGTPEGEDGSSDLTQLFQAIDAITGIVEENKLDNFKYLVIKSTVPPGTTSNRIKPYLAEKLRTRHIEIANNPEFLREGYAYDDFMNPDRVVVGLDEDDFEMRPMFDKLYEPFGGVIHYVMLNEAEYIKCLSNSMLATMISFANDMANAAKHIGGIDIARSFKILHEDRRWRGEPCQMKNYVYPGCGYGGYCLPKDTQIMVKVCKDAGYPPEVMRPVIGLNQKMPGIVAGEIMRNHSPKTQIGILGVAFKPNSDDIRNTPSASIIRELIDGGYTNLRIYDPLAMPNFAKDYSFDVAYAQSLEEIVDLSELLVLLTAWKEFIDNKALLSQKPVMDFRYCL